MTGDRGGTPKFENPGAEEIRALLKRVKTIAVVGLSPNPARPSYGVSSAMQGYGYRIIPVHPAAKKILGETVYPNLSDIPYPVDLVDVFRRPEHLNAIIEECLRLGLKNIWIQDGVVDEAAATKARLGGMTVVMDRCIYRDYRAFCS